MTLANGHDGVQVEGHLPLAALLCGTFDIGEIIVPGLLPDPNQELCELPARRARLRQQFGQRVLQQFVRKQERRFERHGLQTAALAWPRRDFDIRILIQEPTRVLAEDPRQHSQHFGGGHALAGFHHAQVGHRRRAPRIHLNAACRELIEGQAVALAQRTQLRP